MRAALPPRQSERCSTRRRRRKAAPRQGPAAPLGLVSRPLAHGGVCDRERGGRTHDGVGGRRARVRARAGDFLLRPRDRHNLAPTDPLRLLVDAWSSGLRGAGELTLLANNLLNGRYIVAGTDAATDGLCILAQGRDFNLIGQNWLSRVPRLRIADWPDVAYGRWVEQSYRRAWDRAEPLIDDLDCIIQWPKLGRRRHRYGRLILPCRSPSGSRLILGAMRLDADIDLRAQVH